MIYLHLDDVMENRRKQLKGERHEHNISNVLLYFTFYFMLTTFNIDSSILTFTFTWKL